MDTLPTETGASGSMMADAYKPVILKQQKSNVDGRKDTNVS